MQGLHGGINRGLFSLCRGRTGFRCLAPKQCKESFSICRTFAANAAVLEKQEQTSNSPGFGGLGLGDDLLQAVAELRLSSPTEIQSTAIPEVLSGGDVLLASHTGSGKTLAYLLPLIKLLKDAEQLEGVSARPKRPRALVLGPTRELTDQILTVAKSLSHHAKFRSACINGGGAPGQQAANLSKPLDILIGTPQKVVQHAQKGNLAFGDVQYVVLDEADTMFDKGFGPEVKAVLSPVRSKEGPARCILVLATLKKDVQKLLDSEFKELRYVKTSSLHKGVSKARHTFFKVPGLENKFHYLLQAIGTDQAKRRRTMVFCNTMDSCRATEFYLKDNGIATACYHGDVPADGRRDAIQQFCDPDDGVPPVMVCSDLAARGLDLTGGVDHVINFDFPLNPIDYIHRSGRTARAGSSGKITSIVAKKDRVLASRVEDAVLNGRALDELSADRSILPPNLRPKEETLQRRRDEQMAKRNSGKGLRGDARHDKGKKREIVSKRTSTSLSMSKRKSTGGAPSSSKTFRPKFQGLASSESEPQKTKSRLGRPSAGQSSSFGDKKSVERTPRKKRVVRMKSFKR